MLPFLSLMTPLSGSLAIRPRLAFAKSALSDHSAHHQSPWRFFDRNARPSTSALGGADYPFQLVADGDRCRFPRHASSAVLNPVRKRSPLALSAISIDRSGFIYGTQTAEPDRRHYRRWPIGIPRARAFCRIAPGVRFMAFEIFSTGVLLFECAFRSRTCSLDQETRFLFAFVAICLIPVELAIHNT
jgi:hypothetical protein